ncbi:VOC family protein [Aeromicrobium sp. 9AM]|uniref:VOC family protein n=1 Tax=Aeromicrobium sp. 9AM TaxID=2653126 RepID=UPI0012F1A270|nr:VOC family protein [Aeromicrobium sp. 9AM]VXB17350.1 Bleomycin resistance protein [Aeromicrobium sp. 9AM]
MTVQLNHTIVESRDKREAATFFAEILGLPDPQAYGPFLVLQTGNEVSLDFIDAQGSVHPQHYAFLVTDEEFDEVLARIKDRGLSYWADPFHGQPNEINHNDGGRGVYWSDPNGHNLEIITRPYGG